MTFFLRYFALPFETVVYGPSYGILQFLIRSPTPLDAAKTWDFITRQPPPVADWIRLNYPPAIVRPWLLAAKLRQDHVVGISAHYDVSNEFYNLFLDKEYMFYTCADFDSPQDSLQQAQINKANFMLKLIDPQPGEKILELGCGWGSMMKRIVETTGDANNIRGWTLSKEQVEYNRQRHGYHVEFRDFVTADYPPNHFDKIYSIGSWEHVKPNEIGPLSEKLYGALRPGGRVVHHFFCRTSDQLFASIACSQIFFPGSLGSSLRYHQRAFEQAGFRIRQRTAHDYRPTLRAWFENLVANREQAIELVGVRTYNRYVVFFAASWRYFEDGLGLVMRWVLEKPADSSSDGQSDFSRRRGDTETH